MQVYVSGRWHRRMPDLSETSCGNPIDTPRCLVRRLELAGSLCPECHTSREMDRAAANNQKDYP